MKCENCKNKHDGSFGSGRFCSKSCSRSFSTKNKRHEINKKVSEKLTGRQLTQEHRDKLKLLWNDTSYKNYMRRKPQPIENLLVENSSVSTQHIKRRILKENIRPYMCEECGITDTYNGKPIVHQLHHINGNSKDHRLENLQLLCPSCHSQTDNWSGKKHASVAQLD